MTYSGIQGLEMLALDWFCLLVIPGSDWDGPRILKLPQVMNSCLHFFWIFPSFVLDAAPLSSLALGLHIILMY